MGTRGNPGMRHAALRASETLIGQLLGEVLVERNDSILSPTVLAFAVQATQVSKINNSIHNSAW